MVSSATRYKECHSIAQCGKSQTQIDVSANGKFTRLSSPSKCSDKARQAETNVNDAFFQTLSKENGFMIENYNPFDFLGPQKKKVTKQRQHSHEHENKICKAYYFILHEDYSYDVFKEKLL